MQPFKSITSVVVPLDRSNVDTDQIIPKQFLKSVKRTGFGPNLFDEWRYLGEGRVGQDHSVRPINTEFVLNKPIYQGANILLTRENFGCGSSREHAPWALLDYGFRVIIAPSFADIFYNNCFKNGILPIALSAKQVDGLFALFREQPELRLGVDLARQVIEWAESGGSPDGNGLTSIQFELDPFRKTCLLEGLDDIGLTLAKADKIKVFEKVHQAKVPWVF